MLPACRCQAQLLPLKTAGPRAKPEFELRGMEVAESHCSISSQQPALTQTQNKLCNLSAPSLPSIQWVHSRLCKVYPPNRYGRCCTACTQASKAAPGHPSSHLPHPGTEGSLPRGCLLQVKVGVEENQVHVALQVLQAPQPQPPCLPLLSGSLGLYSRMGGVSARAPVPPSHTRTPLPLGREGVTTQHPEGTSLCWCYGKDLGPRHETPSFQEGLQDPSLPLLL